MNVEIYSTESCGHCNRAKHLLTSRGIEYVDIDASKVKEALIQRVIDAGYPAPATVPQIFINGNYIGGRDDLENYFRKVDAE